MEMEGCELMELSIIVPCHNEEDNLELLVSRTESAMDSLDIYWEILLIDDGSTDKTWEVIKRLEKTSKHVRGVRHETNRGIPEGWRSGIVSAGGEYALTTDADLQYLPEDIPVLYKTLKDKEREGVHIVQGCRRKHSRINPLRLMLSKGFSLILNLIFRMRLEDIKSGFLVMRRNIFADVMEYEYNYTHFQHLVTIAASSKGYKIHQVPIKFDVRHKGESNITHPLLFSAGALRDLLPAISEFRPRHSTDKHPSAKPVRSPLSGRVEGNTD